MRHVLGECQRILHRHQRPPRVSQQRNRVEAEAASDAVEVVDLALHRDLDRRFDGERAASPSLVVVDEPAAFSEPVQLREQVTVVEVRATVHHHQRESRAHLADVKPSRTAPHEATPGRSLRPSRHRLRRYRTPEPNNGTDAATTHLSGWRSLIYLAVRDTRWLSALAPSRA